jgi:HD superfamily phosphodiesterase
MLRINRLIQDAEYNTYLRQIQQREANRQFCRHDYQHMVDVARITYLLLLESGDLKPFMEQYGIPMQATAREIVYAAGILHDIGRWREYDTNEDHAVVGARLAASLLQRAGFAAAEVLLICQAVREHRLDDGSAGMLGSYLARADDLSRPCANCNSRYECYKYQRMETSKQLLIY